MYEIEVGESNYNLEFHSKPTNWSNGILVKIYNRDNEFVNSISYSSHPDFPEHDRFSQMSDVQLKQVVLSRIVADLKTDNFKLATENNIKLLLPVNKISEI
jgi:hypothetical protein